MGALVVFLIINDRNSGGGDSVDAGVAAEDAGCTDVEESEAEGQEHVEDGTDIEYGTQPPSSGNHYGTPADAGFYDSAIPEEQAVHNLEHGQIVVWYSSSACRRHDRRDPDRRRRRGDRPRRSSIRQPAERDGGRFQWVDRDTDV